MAATFPPRSMHTGKAFESEGTNLKVCQRSNQHFFKIAHVAMHILAFRTEVDYGITDYRLAQPVIGNLSTAICFKDSDAASREQLRRHQNTGIIATPAHRQSVRMFKQQERIRLLAISDGELRFLLQLKRRHIFEAAQLFHL